MNVCDHDFPSGEGEHRENRKEHHQALLKLMDLNGDSKVSRRVLGSLPLWATMSGHGRYEIESSMRDRHKALGKRHTKEHIDADTQAPLQLREPPSLRFLL